MGPAVGRDVSGFIGTRQGGAANNTVQISMRQPLEIAARPYCREPPAQSSHPLATHDQLIAALPWKNAMLATPLCLCGSSSVQCMFSWLFHHAKGNHCIAYQRLGFRVCACVRLRPACTTLLCVLSNQTLNTSSRERGGQVGGGWGVRALHSLTYEQQVAMIADAASTAQCRSHTPLVCCRVTLLTFLSSI